MYRSMVSVENIHLQSKDRHPSQHPSLLVVVGCGGRESIAYMAIRAESQPAQAQGKVGIGRRGEEVSMGPPRAIAAIRSTEYLGWDRVC